MTGKKERNNGSSSDARLSVARYQLKRMPPLDPAETPAPTDSEPEKNTAGQSMMEARAQYVEMAIQQAIRHPARFNPAGPETP